MAKKQRSDAQKRYFSGYPTKAAQQRERRQARHKKKHPNDTQHAGTSYRRKPSKDCNGWLTRKTAADLGITDEVMEGKAATKASAKALAQNASFINGVQKQNHSKRKKQQSKT